MDMDRFLSHILIRAAVSESFVFFVFLDGTLFFLSRLFLDFSKINLVRAFDILESVGLVCARQCFTLSFKLLVSKCDFHILESGPEDRSSWISFSTSTGLFHLIIYWNLLLQQRNPVPVFGEWESDVPYTAYFERARKANPSSSNNKQIASPVNASCINASTSTCPAGDPTMVLRRHKEVSNAKEGQYPASKELKTRAEVCIARTMTNKPFHPHQEIVLHQGVSRVGAGYGIRSSFVRPWVGGGPRIRLSLEGNNSSESAGVTGSMPFPEKERFHRRPLAEVERVVMISLFYIWLIEELEVHPANSCGIFIS